MYSNLSRTFHRPQKYTSISADVTRILKVLGFRTTPIIPTSSKTIVFPGNPILWVNYNNSLTWNKAIWGWFPILTMIPRVRSQWGRYNLPSYIKRGGSLRGSHVPMSAVPSWRQRHGHRWLNASESWIQRGRKQHVLRGPVVFLGGCYNVRPPW